MMGKQLMAFGRYRSQTSTSPPQGPQIQQRTAKKILTHQELN